MELFQEIEAQSVDMVLCDLPYGITKQSWDKKLPLDELWKHYKRILKSDGVVVLFTIQPYTSELVMSNIDWFKYEYIWEKERPSNYLRSNKEALKIHENILVFSPTSLDKRYKIGEGEKQRSILNYKRDNKKKYHPSEKPVDLLARLIELYTAPGETVLDNCMGGGSTGVACERVGRKFIGIELDKSFYNISSGRIMGHNML